MSTMTAAVPVPPRTRHLSVVRTEQLSLPLTWEVSPGVPAVPGIPRHLRVVGDPGTYDTAGLDQLEVAWVARMARAIGEVAAGVRPAAQLGRWVERKQLERLADRGAAMRRHPSSANGEHQWRTVRSVRLCPVADGIIETSAVLVGERRSRAIALRFEALGGRWLVTAASLV
ncbi:MAG: hypothetical protein RL205_277 [Actinomycetota bacterium]